MPLLSGAANFRAVKPYQAENGRVLRGNTIYRSGELSRLSEADLEIIAQLNICLICDLRTNREQGEFISRWPQTSGHTYLDLPGRDESDAGPHKIFELVAAHPGDTGAIKAMQKLYQRKPRAMANSLRLLFGAILAGNSLPLLIHCHAGKDRTGFMVAMLLAAAGVSTDDIFDDYLTTALYFRPELQSGLFASWAKQSIGLEVDAMALLPLIDARTDYLQASFDEIIKGWGSANNYLETEAGLNGEARAHLQSLLLA